MNDRKQLYPTLRKYFEKYYCKSSKALPCAIALHLPHFASTEHLQHCRLYRHRFDVNRAVHRNIISIVEPKQCTNVSNLFYFGMTLYMFRTVFPSIIRSSRLYI